MLAQQKTVKLFLIYPRQCFYIALKSCCQNGLQKEEKKKTIKTYKQLNILKATKSRKSQKNNWLD